jgi:hypothetical protein
MESSLPSRVRTKFIAMLCHLPEVAISGTSASFAEMIPGNCNQGRDSL